MHRILTLILVLVSVCSYGQFLPTSSKTKFVNGLSIGSKDCTYFTNAGDTVVLYIGRDSAVYTRYKGFHRKLAFDGSLSSYKLIADSLFNNGYTTRSRTKQQIDSIAAVVVAGYVPYSGATQNVDLGTRRLTARSLRMDSVIANGSGGAAFVTNSGNASFSYGAGGSSEVTFNGFAGYNANRASSYTARSFTDKNYVDSADGLRKLAADSFFVSGYTTRGRTKQVIDSISAAYITADALKKNISDTFFTTGYTTRARTKQLSDSLAAVKFGGTVTTNTIPLASGSNTLANSTITQSAGASRVQIGGAADDGATRLLVNGTISLNKIISRGIGSFNSTVADGEMQLYTTVADGITMVGRGSTNDFILANKNGSTVFNVPTGTRKYNW